MVDSLNDAGRIYVQSVIDCHSCNAFGQRYINKQPVTVMHVLNAGVLFFSRSIQPGSSRLLQIMRVSFTAVQTGISKRFLQLVGIDHLTTTVHLPQSNGFCKRHHCTLFDKLF